MSEPAPSGWWRTRSGLALAAFLAVVAFFLLTEHAAHVFGVLPYLLILACPLLHAFGHRDHHDGRSHGTGHSSHTEEPHGEQRNAR